MSSYEVTHPKREEPNNPFRVREIFASILDQLDNDTECLRACAQVCKDWEPQVVLYLWGRFRPPISALAGVQDPERRNHYAKIIRYLSFNVFEARTHHNALSKLNFSSLRELILEYHWKQPLEKKYLSQYLHPQLRRIEIHNDSVSDDFLVYLHNHCPDLITFLLGLKPKDLTKGGLSWFMTKHEKGWQQVSFPNGAERMVSEAVIQHLARAPSLLQLALGSRLITFNEQLVESLEAAENAPFPHLSHLSCRANTAPFERLCAFLGALQNLDITLDDSPFNGNGGISLCRNLRVLRVNHCGQEVVGSSAWLVKLAENCKNLRSIAVVNIELDDFTDEILDLLASSWPQLERLSLKLEKCVLSVQALRSLGGRCHKLKYCLLAGAFDMLGLHDDKGCLFPKLEELSLEKLSLEQASSIDDISVDRVVKTFRRHTPKLSAFAVDSYVFTEDLQWILQQAIRETLTH